MLSLIALLAIIAAWLNGARFIGGQASAASFAMAMGTAVALLCYVIILAVPQLTAGASR